MPSIEGGSIVDEDLLTVVAVNEADPSLRNKKFQFDELVVYLDQYFQNTSGNTFSGDIIVGGNATISGLTTTSGITVTHAATVSGLTVQDDAIVSGTISGGIVSGNTSSFNQSEIQIGTIVTLTGTTFTYSTGVVTSFFSGAVITGDTINALNFATSNFTAAYISGGTVTGISGEFGTLTAQSVTLSGVTVTDALTVSGALGVSGLLTASGAYITGTITGNTITGNSIYGTSGIFTYVSGTTITGDLISVTSGVYAHVSGATITGNNISGAGGQFAHLSGATITGDAVSATVVTGVSGVFTNISGTSGVFTNITGTNIQANRMDVETGVFQDLTAVNMTFQGDQTISGNFTVIENQVISGNLRVVGNITGESNLIIEQTGFIENIVSSGIISGSTINGNLVQANSGVYTYLSGATITGDLISGTSGVYTYVSGTSITGDTIQATSGIFVTGSFTDLEISGLVSGTSGVYTYLSGATITGDLISGTSGVFTNLSGLTITGDTIQATSGIFVTGSFTDLEISGLILSTGLFASGTESEPSITFVDDTNTGFYNAAANEVRITTNGTDRLTVDDTGRVGIGTTDPRTPLEIVGTILQDDFITLYGDRNSGNSEIGIEFKDRNVTSGGQDAARIYSQRNGTTQAYDLKIATGNLGTLSDQVTVKSDGKVGIGTGSPQQALEISASVPVVRLTDTDGTNQYGEIQSNAGNVTISSRNDASNGAIVFRGLAANEYARITSDGNVGIGTTNPAELLHIRGDVAEFKGTNTSSIDVTAGTEQVFKFGIEGQRNSVYGPAGSIIFRQDNSSWSGVSPNFKGTRIEFCTQDSTTTDTSETPRLVVDQIGRVGIGTTDPLVKLEVTAENTSELLRITRTNAGEQAGIGFAAVGTTNRPLIGCRANDFVFDVGGSEAARITSGGLVGIGTSSPAANLQVQPASSNTAATAFTVRQNNSADTSQTSLSISIDPTTNTARLSATGTSSPNLAFLTTAQECARFDSSGRLLVGTSNSRITGFGIIPKVQIEGVNSVTDAAQSITLNRTDNLGPRFVFAKSKGNTLNSNTIVAENDELGNIYFCGADGTDISTVGAAITANVDGTPGANDMPGRLVFATTADGGSTPTERMRITSDGKVGIGTSTPGAKLDIKGTSGTYPTQIIQHSELDVEGEFLRTSRTDSGVRYHSIVARQSATTTTGNNYIQFKIHDPSGGQTAQNTALHLDGTGNVGIGTTNPTELLFLEASSTPSIVLSDTTTANTNSIFRHSNGTLRIDAKFNNNNGVIAFTRNGTASESARFDTFGRLLVGTSSSSQTAAGFSPNIQAAGTGATAALSVTRYSNNTLGPVASISKSRGTSVGLHALVAENDELGRIDFEGSNGNNFVLAANIAAAVDGTPATGGDLTDMPGRLVFSTSSDGASTPTERMRIDSDGRVGIGTTDPVALLTSSKAVSGGEGGAIAIQNASTGVDTTAALYLAPNVGAGNNLARAASIVSRQTTSGNFADLEFSVSNGADPAEAMRITSDGNVGIGTSDPQGRLDVATAGDSSIVLANETTYTDGLKRGRITKQSDNSFVIQACDSASAVNTVFKRTISVESMRIDSAGRLLVGTSSARANFYNGSNTAQIQLEGTNFQNAAFAITCNANSPDKGGLIFAKSRGTTVGSNTVVQNGDSLGAIDFQGADGSEFVSGANIKAEVDGTPGADDMPGRLVFSTTADAAATPTERMRIGNAGNILMGTSSAIISGLYTLQVAGGRGAVIKSTGGGSNSSLTLWNNDNVNDCSLIDFRTNTVDTTRGSITYNASTGLIQYNTTSDYRAKTLNGLLQNASDSVASLSVYEGTMNGATQSMPMMVAHEVQEVAPYCVTGEKDATDENGEPVYQQLDYTAMVPLLTAALQEALAKIETLEQRLTDAGL